jgi:hypothetical protein
LALTSTIILSIVMERVLLLKWDNNWSCGASFEELFVVDDFIQKSEAFFPWNETDVFTNAESLQECKLDLSQHDDFLHFWFLKDVELYKKMDTYCDVILIRSIFSRIFKVIRTRSFY